MASSLTIGTVTALKSPDEIKFTPDERKIVHKTIGGVFVYDAGVVSVGEVISLSRVIFKSAADWQTVKEYWLSRSAVDIVDMAGNTLSQRKISVKEWGYVQKHERYYWASIELSSV